VRILIVHSRYLTGAVSGENRVVEDETRVLREGGHEVTSWTPEPVPPDQQGMLALVRTSGEALWSRRASAQLRSLLDDRRPEVVHFHNLYPMLSPAVIRAADGLGVPVVMTLHNYRLFCLPATLERDGQVCERCVGHLPLQGVRFRCYRNSVAGSAVVATSLGLHRGLRSFERVRRFLPVSRFVQDKYVEAGFDGQRMRVKPNFAWEGPRRTGPGSFFLYAGRLSREKGVVELVSVWRSEFGRLLIVGTGPEGDRVRAAAASSDAGGSVECMGAVSPESLRELIAHARAVVVPSVGLETSGRVIMEAYASGVPVVANRIGALPEAVEEGVSGVLVAPGDRAGWIEAVRGLGEDARSLHLGEGAATLWAQRYSPALGLRHLESAYAEAMAE
jgi:glycosyltransferase involved in cell wall biosynthesis